MFSSIRLRQQASPRRGLTLVELVVVLTILVALGGLIVPVLPSMLAKTHQAKCSTTIPEVNKLWIQAYTGDVAYPDGYDSLLDQGQALADTIPGGGNAGGELARGRVTANEAAALAAIGVTTVVDIQDAGNGLTDNATVNAAPLGAPTRALTGGGPVAVLANVPGASSLSLGIKPAAYPTDAKFVVFGIGQNCSGVGSGGLMVEAPIHFGGEDVMNPSEFYQRYCVIFMVSDSEESAEFVCACSVHPDGFDGAEAHIRDYYDDQQ